MCGHTLALLSGVIFGPAVVKISLSFILLAKSPPASMCRKKFVNRIKVPLHDPKKFFFP